MANVSELKLSFHVPKVKLCFFDGDEEGEESMFTAWLSLNRDNPLARTLTYEEIPTRYTWNRKEKQFMPRRRGFQRGKLADVQRDGGELYFLRILLGVVKGPTCDEDLREFEGVVYGTYKEACLARGFIE